MKKNQFSIESANWQSKILEGSLVRTHIENAVFDDLMLTTLPGLERSTDDFGAEISVNQCTSTTWCQSTTNCPSTTNCRSVQTCINLDSPFQTRGNLRKTHSLMQAATKRIWPVLIR